LSQGRLAEERPGFWRTVGLVVLLTDWIDWPRWIGVGLGSPLVALLALGDGAGGELFGDDWVGGGLFGGDWGGGDSVGGGGDGGGGGG
jgi:hypothetical protein